jgi:hypothetical protein
MAVPIPEITQSLHRSDNRPFSGRILSYKKSEVGGTKAALLTNLHIIIFFSSFHQYMLRLIHSPFF